MVKIFNFHLNKCGTTSLTRLLELLGYKGFHYFVRGKPMYEIIKKQGLKNFPRFDFISEVNKLDFEDVIKIHKEYPDALFILTTRDKKERQKSMIRYNKKMGWNSPIDSFERHDNLIKSYKEYFKENLLILPLEADNKLELVCDFLVIKPPKGLEYPKLNEVSQL